MDATTLFEKLTADVTIQNGQAVLPQVPGAGFEATTLYSETFGELLN
jgi:hypothetical protein